MLHLRSYYIVVVIVVVFPVEAKVGVVPLEASNKAHEGPSKAKVAFAEQQDNVRVGRDVANVRLMQVRRWVASIFK